MKNVVAKSAVAGTVLLLSASAASAAAIDVQFGAASAGQQQTGAAVIGAAGDYWNYSNAASGTNGLLDTSNSKWLLASGVVRSAEA